MRLIIDSKTVRIEISNISRIDDNGCDLELYSDPACTDPMEILIDGYWSIVSSDSFYIEKSHLQCAEAVYLIPDDLRKDEEEHEADRS